MSSQPDPPLNAASNQSLAVVVLAAGHGTRMRSTTPKVLHEIGGRSMLAHVLETAAQLSPERTIVVVGAQGERVAEAARAFRPDIAVAVQEPPRGTGDAVIKAQPFLEGFNGVVLVLYADTPLVRSETLSVLIHDIDAGAAAAVLGFREEGPHAYGRLKQSHDGSLLAIVEAKDATPDELQITFCNSGMMAVDASFLRKGLPRLTNNNAKREFYLTDLIAIARDDGLSCAAREAGADETMGVDSRSALAIAEARYQERRRAAAMEAGVTLIDPSTVYFSSDTILENDVTVEPHVFFGPGVRVGSGAQIKAFSHLEGARVANGATIGPYARLRPGAEIGANAKIGNFVEVKKASIGGDAKVNHLSYVGDADVGPRANIGAGVITCNYDGFNKHKTEIGAGAFVGSNSALVAPVKIGDDAYVGSGSVITKTVEPGDLAVARGRQSAIKGWAVRFRKAHNAAHDKDKN